MSDNKLGCDTGQTLLPVAEAIQQLKMAASVIAETEWLDIADATGRILAESVESTVNVPPADNSAMDGYAFNLDDLLQSRTLPVSQRIPAGHFPDPLKLGTAARIFTGGVIPQGADTVAMQETCQTTEGHVEISGDFRVGENIRQSGEDIQQGDSVLSKGQCLTPQMIGLAASVGVAKLSVVRRMKVAVLSTGDELCDPGVPLQKGQIYNSNRYTLIAMLKKMGCDVVDMGRVADSFEATRAVLLEASEHADFILTSGGVSVGEEDHVKAAVESTGKIDMWRMNTKPGKPLAFGYVNDVPFMGLPGNPVSVFATFYLFARPFIMRTQGQRDDNEVAYQIPADFSWPRAGTRDEYVRVQYSAVKGLTLYPNQSSGVLTSTVWATGFAYIPAGTTVEIGDELMYLPFNELIP